MFQQVKFNVYSKFIHSTVAGENGFFFWGGGQLGEQKLEGSGGKPLKLFEIFIPEIAANASNFKN